MVRTTPSGHAQAVRENQRSLSREQLRRWLLPPADEVSWSADGEPQVLQAHLAERLRKPGFFDRFGLSPSAGGPALLGWIRAGTIHVAPAHRYAAYADVPEFDGRCFKAADGRSYVSGRIQFFRVWFPPVWLGGVALFLVLQIALAAADQLGHPVGTGTGTSAGWVGTPVAMLVFGALFFGVRRRAGQRLRKRLLSLLAEAAPPGSVMTVNGLPYDRT